MLRAVGPSAAAPFATHNPDTKAPTVTAEVAGSGTSRTFIATASDTTRGIRVECFMDGPSRGSALVTLTLPAGVI
ncbi:MAG: hypothetical protein U0P46_14295, partial [Holophagaceae bacterium]